MNYEEKLREIINNNSEYYPCEDKAVFAKYFPELQEDRDKRMRENLYKCLRYYVPNDIAEEYIKWLEKIKD